MIDTGPQEGAKLEFGGDAPRSSKRGAYVNPTLFTGVKNDMTIAQQEIFGPVAAVIEFDGVEEAIAIANDTIYGLAAGVWTRDLDTAFRLVREHRGRHHLDQLLRRGRHDPALRRLQAVRQRARQVPRQHQELHAVEVGLVPAVKRRLERRVACTTSDPARSDATRSRS